MIRNGEGCGRALPFGPRVTYVYAWVAASGRGRSGLQGGRHRLVPALTDGSSRGYTSEIKAVVA